MKTDSGDNTRSWQLWLWVGAAFLLLAAAWMTLIIIAIRNQPEPVRIEAP
jgi:hypothetical protein